MCRDDPSCRTRCFIIGARGRGATIVSSGCSRAGCAYDSLRGGEFGVASCAPWVWHAWRVRVRASLLVCGVSHDAIDSSGCGMCSCPVRRAYEHTSAQVHERVHAHGRARSYAHEQARVCVCTIASEHARRAHDQHCCARQYNTTPGPSDLPTACRPQANRIAATATHAMLA